jgi:hypothetical protein
MSYDDRHEQESVLQERINILKDKGYRGFTVDKGKSKFDGVKVSVKSSAGRELVSEGETLDEAFENMIELIDYTLDDNR